VTGRRVGGNLSMFFAGVEIDADEFLRTRDKALRFGIASFA
jgi:Kef-type K+ transport system membrane component KefB